MAVAHDSQNNVFVTGRAMIEGQGTQMLVIKLRASDGEVLWVEHIGGSAGADDIAWDITIGQDDHPVISGFIVGAGDEAFFLTRKLNNADGHTVWERVESGALNNVEVRSAWLAQMDNGDVVMAQRTFSTNGYDVILKRYAAADGATVWETVYDGPTHGGDDVRDMKLDSQGNLLLAGVQDTSWNYNFMALKFDSSDGSLIWEASYDGPPGWYDVANAIAEGPGGTVIVTGLSDGIGTGWDWATVAYEGITGNELWVERYDGPAGQSDEAREVICTTEGDIVVTGYGYGEGTNKDLITIRYKVENETPAGETPAAVIATRAWPNPFNPRVNISFDLPHKGLATLIIYDLKGRAVATLKNEILAAGSHEAAWNGRDSRGQIVAAGTYMALVSSGDLHSVQKIVLAK